MTPRRPAFTLLELILAIVVGFSLSALLVQMGTMMRHHTDALATAQTQTDLLRESEALVGSYRDHLDTSSSGLGTMLGNWAPGEGVAKDVQQISVGDTGGTYTFSVTVYKVTLSRDGQSYNEYFTE